MKNPILHIPSVITQSCFVDSDGEIIDLLSTEIDYFYALLYLYREQLLEQTQNLLLKNGKRYLLNQSATIEAVEIELNQFQRCGAVANFKYDGLRQFIDNLSELSISINLLRKNKDREIETIRIIDSYHWDSTLLTIKFADDFVNELIGIEKFFMEVNLTHLLKLSGGKAKSLYLILKDYSNVGNKNFTKDELILLIGKVPQTSVLNGIVEQINEKTDIKVSYSVEGVKKKKYKFKINHKVNLKSTLKGKAKTKKSINVEVMEKSKKQLQQMKDKGQKIGNEKGYLKTIYANEMDKLNRPTDIEVEKTKAELALEQWIDTTIDELKSEGRVNFNHNNYLVLKAHNMKMDRTEELLIGDDYKIYNRMDWERNSPITIDSESTMDFINEYEIKKDVYCAYGQTIGNTTYSQIRR